MVRVGSRAFIEDAIIKVVPPLKPFLVSNIREKVSKVAGRELTVQRISQHLVLLKEGGIVDSRRLNSSNNLHEWWLC